MGSVNVNRNVSDQFNRYTMPRIIAKVEGKGNGIKTVIVNMPEVAKALSRPPTYPTKYFGCELGAQTQFDLKNERYIVNGSHDALKLQDLLDGFIKKFVLCPTCDNPETTLTIQARKGIILQRCLACGHSGNIDMRHKLTTFILKNPPDQDAAMTPGKKEKKDKKAGKKGKDGEASPEAGDAPQESGERKTKGSKSAVEEEDDDDWGEDTSEAAVQQRMEALSTAAKGLAMSDDIEKTAQQRIDIFYAFVKLKKQADQLGGSYEKELVAEAERLELRDKSALVLAELLFNDNMLAQMKVYRSLLLRFSRGNQKFQRYLLGGIELLVKLYPDALLPKVGHILKAFYDTDILEEEVLLDWDLKPSKKYVSKELCAEMHTKAAPFIRWLAEAEEETSEDDDDDDGVQITTAVKEAPLLPVKTEDDIDIDAI